MKTIEELKAEATELGISFRDNITAEPLAKRIDEFYAAQEAATLAAAAPAAPTVAAPAVVTVVSDAEQYRISKEEAVHQYRAFARQEEAKARKTRVVTIIDNDQRVNNQTTTCTVNCSNEYFDLGTLILPLNEKVEVRQGHIDALLEVRIPRHMKNPKDPSLSIRTLVARYTIQYENIGE